MGSDKQLKPSSFGSHPFSGDVPIHGEPSLEGFFISASDRTSRDSRVPAWAAGEKTLAEVSPAY